jgi:hypothetical protein
MLVLAPGEMADKPAAKVLSFDCILRDNVTDCLAKFDGFSFL